MTNEGLIVGTPQGPRLVRISEETEIRVGEEEVGMERLRRGAPVAVFGEFSEDVTILQMRDSELDFNHPPGVFTI